MRSVPLLFKWFLSGEMKKDVQPYAFKNARSGG